MFGVPVIELSLDANFHDVIESAFKLSSNFSLPVIIRTTTRLLQSYYASTPQNTVELGDVKVEKAAPKLTPLPGKIFSSPADQYHLKQKEKLGQIESMDTYLRLNISEYREGSKRLVISSGRATAMVDEWMMRSKGDVIDHIRLLTIFPFPDEYLAQHLTRYESIIVIEEGDDIVETSVKRLLFNCGVTSVSVVSRQSRLPSKHNARPLYLKSTVGELTSTLVAELLEGYVQPELTIQETSKNQQKIKGHLCAGCPHSSSLYALNMAKKLSSEALTVIGDVGCYTMGIGDAGYNTFDTAMCMGASISLGVGIQSQYQRCKEPRRVISVIGDSTFFHAGIPALIQAKKRSVPLVVMVLDNHVTAMTGGQQTVNSTDVSISQAIEGLGIEVNVVQPYDMHKLTHSILDALSQHQLTVLLVSAPCQLYEGITHSPTYAVDTSLCVANSCRCQFRCQHDFQCVALSLDTPDMKYPYTIKANIDEQMCNGCGACASLCAHGAIKTKKEML
ncbi:thiamine pyrophosphate-dependent enzyme [Enterovibrio coralii]|uniref:Indolepyruvate oxidoreductase subunit IorA n=1 Tax=Enterovibrio coralii TaxID=294935 RepID=A0A135I506_9GAMM|nr:thiamine pyrophosphate-dependent enzyme [Enterovibrio coralii]KXF80536.1 hypothetical protein ATN88_07570 [Enterovibrio coralii]